LKEASARSLFFSTPLTKPISWKRGRRVRVEAEFGRI
jgi:hypothetical protein